MKKLWQKIFPPREPYTEEALGHNHEWDELWIHDEKGSRPKEGNWVYCWICGTEEKFENIKNK